MVMAAVLNQLSLDHQYSTLSASIQTFYDDAHSTSLLSSKLSRWPTTEADCFLPKLEVAVSLPGRQSKSCGDEVGIRTWLGLKKKRSEPQRPTFWNDHSFSQLQQDRWVLSELGEKRSGYFVEIGAFDGKTLSNTYLLEKEYGWSGILAEPNPAFWDGIERSRRVSLCMRPVDAVTGKSVKMRFVTSQPEFSGMADHASKDKHAAIRSKDSVEIMQSTISLNDLLQTHHAPDVIDFISIDTEGSEPDIISTLDFNRFKVRLFCIEHNHTDAEARLDAILLLQGYERVYREWSRWDAWYRKTI